MKSDGPIRHFLLAFLLATICYIFFYRSIEYRRIRKGPWQVTFTNNATGVPLVLVNQPKLAITNVQLVFPDQSPPPPSQFGTFLFSQPQPVPFQVGFASCVFMDTTFLPGTLTFDLYGHEVELLPRVLVIDRQEHYWLPETPIILHSIQPRATNPPPTEARQDL